MIRISFKTKQIELTPEIRAYAEEKISLIEKLIPEADTDAVLAEVDLGKTTAGQKTGDIYRAEVNLTVAGQLIRAEAVDQNINSAIDEVRAEIERRLRKMRTKQSVKTRRGGDMLKRLMRFGRSDK
jgi:putative sigma-54 modulation protein